LPSHLRRRCARLAVLLLALLAVAACIEIPTFNTTPTVHLRIAVPSQTQATYLAERVKGFETANPTIDVEVFSQMAQFRGNLVQAINSLSTTGSGLDLIYLTDTDFQSVSSAGVLTDLSSFIRQSEDLGSSQFYPLSLPVFQNRGRQMVMPAELYPLMVFYNQDMFDKADLKYPTAGWTVRDFQVAAKALTNTAGGPQQATYGFVSDLGTSFWPFVFAFGGDIPDPDRDPRALVLTSPGEIQGFQFVVDLINRDKVFPIDQYGRGGQVWYGGRAGMALLYMNGRNVVPQQTDTRGPVPTPTPGPRQTWGFRWNVATVPGQASRATLVQVAGYGIPKDAKNPDEAWQLIRYLVDTLPEPGTAPGYVPALKALARSEDFTRLYPESGRQAYLDSVDIGKTIPAIPSSLSFTDNDIRPLIVGEISVADALQQFQRKWAAAFQQQRQ
jgi:multiple sugar transport system substrate-binding protein